MVEWGDAHASSNWTTDEDIAKNSHSPAIVTWVGFLVKDDEQGVTPAFGFEHEGNRPAGAMFVPRGMVLKVTKIKVKS